MPLNKTNIKNILIISLSNIGDVVLTFPVFDLLRNDFPQSRITVVIGPKAAALLIDNPNIDELVIFDKHQSLRAKFQWAMQLRKQKFDLIVDLRNSLFPFLIGSRYRTSVIDRSQVTMHKKYKHLHRLKSVYAFANQAHSKLALSFSDDDQHIAAQHLKSCGLTFKSNYVVIAPGAADRRKRWSVEGFAALAEKLLDHDIPVIFVGNQADAVIVKDIQSKLKKPSLNLAGIIDLKILAKMMEHAQLIISNDSSPMHIASYLNKPVVALFGLTNPVHYGPWSQQQIVFQHNQDCPGCRMGKLETLHTCMQAIKPEMVLKHLNISNGIVTIKGSKKA